MADGSTDREAGEINVKRAISIAKAYAREALEEELGGAIPSLEEVYLHAYASVPEARASVGRYLASYNGRRPHSSLGGQTPDQAYLTPLQPIRAAA